MSQMNVRTLRDSFELARPHALKIVNRFYEILWTDYPIAQTLFVSTDMVKQKHALVGSLAYIVDHLEDGPLLTKYLENMGERHVRYGVEDPHYDMVGNSLLKTFSEAFGEAWTRDLAEQWAMAVGFIATTMRKGAARVQKPVQEAEQAAPLAPITEAPITEAPLSEVPLPPAAELRRSVEAPKTKRSESMKIELPSDLRQEIRKAVREALQEAIQAEIQTCIQEEISQLSQSQVTEILKKRAS